MCCCSVQILPVDSSTVTQAISEGRVWLLDVDSTSQSGTRPCLGALIVHKSRECRRWALGIVAREPSAIHSGILLAGSPLLADHAHFVTFISRSRGCAVPDVYRTSTVSDWVLYGKSL